MAMTEATLHNIVEEDMGDIFESKIATRTYTKVFNNTHVRRSNSQAR